MHMASPGQEELTGTNNPELIALYTALPETVLLPRYVHAGGATAGKLLES